MVKAQRGRREAPVPIRSVAELFDRLPEGALLQPPELRRCHERWRLLWEGMLQLLRDHDEKPYAYERVLAKLQRHGLGGLAPAFELIGGRRTARERIALAAGLTDPEPTDGILKAVASYARDRRTVSLRGERPFQVSQRSLLVMACYGARWKLQQEPLSKVRRRGDPSLEEKAVELVAKRYSLTSSGAADSIKRARAALHPTMKRWILSLCKKDGHLLWGLAMDPTIDLPVPPPA